MPYIHDESTPGQGQRVRRPGILVAVIGLLAIAAGCGAEAPDETMETMNVTEGPSAPASAAEPAVDTLVDAVLAPVAVAPEDEVSAVDGRVLVLWRAAGRPLELVVRAEGLAMGDHAWDIHAGSCTSPGPVALALSETDTEEGAVGPLVVDQERRVDETFEVSELAGLVPSQGQYTLHIHSEPGIVHTGDMSQDVPTLACARL